MDPAPHQRRGGLEQPAQLVVRPVPHPPGAGDSAQISNGGTCIVDQPAAIAGVQVMSASTFVVNNQLVGTHQLHIGTFGAASHVQHNAGLATFSLIQFGDWWGNAGGTYTLDGGAELRVAASAYIGKRSPATFTQNSGTVTIWSEALVGWGRTSSYLLNGGSVTCDHLALAQADHPAYPDSTALFRIGDATLTADILSIDKLGDNTGILRIVDSGAVINIDERVRIFGRWEATAPGTLNLRGADIQLWTDDAEAVAGLANTVINCTGDTQSRIELGSADHGSTPAAGALLTHNFEFGALNVTGTGPTRLVDLTDNQQDGHSNEVGYVYTLSVAAGATLDLGGQTLYVQQQSIDPDATVTDSVGGGQILPFTPGGCNDADLVAPFGVLGLSDVNAFVEGFLAGDPIADLDPDGVHDLSDVVAFVDAFNAGCI